MDAARAIYRFIKGELLAVGFILTGAAVFVYNAVSGALQLWTWGIPGWGWQIIAAVLLVSGVLVIAFRLHQRMEQLQRAGPEPKPHPRAEIERRRELISKCRDLVYKFTNGGDTGFTYSFRKFLERSREYPDIRRHLSAEYLKKLHAPRTVYAGGGEAAYHPLAQWFLDELDRLEREWGVDG